jgi:hypothetical protein
MKMRLHRAALAALLVTAGSQSFAQMGGGMGGRQRGHAPEASASEQAPDPRTVAAQTRDKLSALRLRLMLMPEQTPSWEKFYNAVWEMGGRNDWSSSLPGAELTAVQALQQRAAQAQQRATRLQALSDAAANLYAVLTPDQRRTADQELPGVLPAERAATPPGAGTP